MSEWNLSVRLTGQGSSLKNTLKESAAEARKLARDVDKARRSLTELRVEARNGIKAKLELDAGNLRQDVRAALAGAGGQGLTVDLQLGNAQQLRRDVQNAVRWAAWGHRIDIPIGLRDPNRLRTDVTAAVRAASLNQVIRVRVAPDTSALRNLDGNSGGGSGGGFGLAGFLPFATAAIPLAGGLTASIGPLAGVFAAAAGGAAVFGAALAGQIGPMSEAAEAEKAYQDAVQEHGRTSAEAGQAQLAYQRKLAALPPETQKAVVALSGLKTEFRAWSDDMSSFTMGPVTKAFTILQELLPSLSPEVRSFSGELDRLMNVAGGAISTPGFDAFSTKVAELTDQKLDTFTDQVIHLLRVASEGDAGGGTVGQILAYMRQNAPAARDAVESLGEAVSTLLEGASDAGPVMLTLVSAVAGLVGALPPEVVTILLQVAAGLKLVQLAAAGSTAAAAAVTRLTTSVQLLGARSAAAGGGLAGLRAAVAGLSTGAKLGLAAAGVGALALALHELSDNKPAVGVDELSTSLNTLVKTGKVTGALKGNFTEMSQSIAMVSKEASDNKLAQWTSDFGTWIGISTGPGISTARKNLDAWDKAMAANVKNGHPKEAAAQWEILKKAWMAGGGSLARLEENTTDYSNALADSAFEAEMTAESMGTFGSAALKVSAQLDAQKGAADGLRASLIALNDTNRSAYDAEIGFQEALDNLTESFKKNGATLDIHTEAGRRNGEAMSAASKAQSEMIVTGMAAGSSFQTMVGQTDALRSSMLKLATEAFDGNKRKAQEYVNTLLGTPKEVKTLIKAERADAVAGLNEVIEKIRATPDAKSVTVKTLSAGAMEALRKLGFTVTTLPDGSVTVTAATGTALSNIGAVQGARDRLSDKSITITTVQRTVMQTVIQGPSTTADLLRRQAAGFEADGGVVDFYAAGGMRENHVAQIAQGGSWRVWAEDETQGESYIPLARSKRPRSRKIAEETVRRLGGDPGAIDWYANGGLDFSYASSGSSASKYTLSGLVSASNDKKGNFSLSIFTKKLAASNNALAAWRTNLAIVASRAGQDVADALEEMGDEGIALTKKMATGSSKYVKGMAKELQNLANAAKASLGEYTSQLKDAVKDQTTFQANLVTLAARGYGDLAGRLASSGDADAESLAAAAVKDNKKASSANAAAKAANKTLSDDQVEQLVSIIASITTKSTGIHDVASKTGLGEDEIVDVAGRATSQIKSSLGSRATQFLADLAKAQKGLAYADGGIRSGIYATRGGAVTFAEPSTGGEAYIPLGASKRHHALPVLSDVASRFGKGLTDGNAGRVVIVREQGPLVGSQTWHVSSNGSPADVARQIDADNGYQLRRLARGGVGARG